MRATKSQYKPFFIGLFCFSFWLATCPYSWGQDLQKRFLSKEEYSLWSKLVARKLSSNGNWASYLLLYETKKDTLFVKNTKDNVTYNFPNAREGEFNGELTFGCVARDTLMLQNLHTGSLTKIPGVVYFAFSANQEFVVMLKRQTDDKYTLEIHDNTGRIAEKITNMSRWSFSLEPNHKGIAYVTASEGNYGIEFIKLETGFVKKTILSNSKSEFKNLIWKNNTIAFLKIEKDNSRLFSYNIEKEKLQQFDPARENGFPVDMKISDELYNNLLISDDEEHIFFWLKESPERLQPIDPKAVQIWNTKDRLLFDHKKYIGEFSLWDKMAVWSIKENKFLQITDRQLPRGFLSGDYAHAFIYDPIAYEPQSSFDGPVDFYLVDLKTGSKRCILKRYSRNEDPIGSPNGAYLCYTKENNWWIYDVKKNTHTNITFGLSEAFFREDQDMPSEARAYGFGGWSKDGRSIILYDAYDLWEIAVNGGTKKRLTGGREIQKTYRIKDFASGPRFNGMEARKETVDINSGFVLEALNQKSGESGLSKWTPENGVIDMLWENKKISQVHKAANKDVYMYIEQNYTAPPRLMSYDQSPKEIIQTNKQQQFFYWGKTEVIEYMVNDKKMQGILYYPAGYNPTIKYPMIVEIYQRQFQNLNDYENPTVYISNGFNISNFIQQGYFVLRPDMAFEMANVARSATKSVLAAVDVVIEKGLVNPKKVGLTGHSFGGYETDLIITQTNRFATAVSGAAWTDLVSSYLYVGATFRRPDFYRGEYDQWRIGKSLFEDTQSYLKNSPVLLAGNVKTPLLAWAGEDDRHIHSLQSMEFYMALRRLGKTHTLLVYPEEGHNLHQGKNQKDLSERVEQWFGYYLKDEKPSEWMVEGAK